jgi:site-specific recombinase XerD
MRANALTVAQRERLPHPLRIDELRKLFAELDRPCRLMAEWALGTGLRRMELCGLKVSQVPDTANLNANVDPLIGVPLTITKGDRPRTVYPPLRLIDRTHWYVGEERAALVKSVRRRSDFRPPPNLFLNRDGKAVTRARLSGAFNAAFHAAGLNGSLHWLRHTFAMTMLVRLQRRVAMAPDSDLNPLKVVQVLLGHASIATTAIYLRCVELHERELGESLAYLYGELIPDDHA